MTETLTPQEAAAALARANRWEDRLAHRTEGISWMIWGLVSAGVWTTLQAASSLPLTALGFASTWIAWLLAGTAMTYALWRSAALTKPATIRPAPWWTHLVKALLVGGGLLLLHYVVEPTTPAFAVAFIGLLWIGLALLTRRWSPLGRRAALAIGLLILLGGVLIPYALAGMQAMMLAAALVTGSIPLLGGFWQTLRG